MRDILVTLVVLGSLPYILGRPWIGILVWSWLSYMNPHRLAWGFAYSMPFAQIVALTLLVGLLMSSVPKRIPVTPVTLLWWAFLLWMGISTMNAIFPEPALEQFIKVIKIQLVTFLTLMLITKKEQIIPLIWVIALSIGFFGIKGGVFTIMTGGQHRVWGPPGTFISDNNELALALLMVLPLFVFLRSTVANPWLRRALLLAMILIGASVVGSQSRGALLGGAAVGTFLWLKGQRKLQIGLALAVVVAAVLALAPEAWFDRMRTIENYEEDGSAMGRIVAWQYAMNIATDRITGGGYSAYSRETFAIWAPTGGHEGSLGGRGYHAAHSIYFGVLADHGWPGAIMFVGLLVMAWRMGSWIIKHAGRYPDMRWLVDLARMIQVSLIAYMVGGAFYSLGYFDLPYHLIAVLVVGKELVKRREGEAAEQVPESVPRPAPRRRAGVPVAEHRS